MYPCHFTNINSIDESTSGNVCCKDICVSNNHNHDTNTNTAPKHKLFCNFLNINTHPELYQGDDYQEKLLPLDIFKLTKLDESNSSSDTYSFDTSQPPTSKTIKRQLIEDEPLSIEPITKIICLKQIKSNEKNCISSLSFREKIITKQNVENPEQTIQNHSTRTGQSIIKKELRIKLCRCNIGQRVDDENVIKKNISLKFYSRRSHWMTKYNSRIVYRDAIKKIDIDNNGLFRDSVLGKIYNHIKKYSLKPSINLSKTYSNIRKYALDKLSSLLNDETLDLDILITPRMSISDLRSSCISNQYFFKKLRENCEKIAENTRATPESCLSDVFQCQIIFDHYDSFTSTNTKIKLSPRKDKLLPKLKELIIDTVSNLPNSIICEIEKLSQSDIVNALFLEIHGVLISKSLIKNLNLLFISNKREFINSKFDDDLNLLNYLLNKIGNLVRESCIFHDGVFLPDEYTVEKLSKYLLSDMYGVSSMFHGKLKLLDKKTSKSQETIDDISLDNIYNIKTKTEKIEIGNNCNYNQGDVVQPIKNIERSEQQSMTIELSLKRYCRNNLCSTERTSSIYENAIKKIIIDNNFRFEDSVLREIGTYITSKGFTKSSLNLSKTYSNVLKYVLDKVSPYIRNIVANQDLLISSGMSLSDIRYNYISNNVFFEKLGKDCEEIVKNIHLTPNYYFSGIIQNYIYLGSPERLEITSKKNKLCAEVKMLIIETISNLPNNIIHELKKFSPNDMVNGLFSKIHGLYLHKPLINNLRLLYNSNKFPNDDHISNLDSLNNLLTTLLNKVKKSPILYGGKIFLTGERTSNLLSKYLLLDMYKIPFRFHKKLTPKEHINDNILESNHKKHSVTETYNSMEPLLKKTTIVPQKKYKWNPGRISSSNVYELALSTIEIDKGDFEYYFIDKVRRYKVVQECLSKKGKINVDLSETYNRTKNYILEIFIPFFREIEHKIKLTNGMSIDELRHSYISNTDIFDKLRNFCAKMVSYVKNCNNIILTNMIQHRVGLETEIYQVMKIKSKRKIVFRNCMEKLLIRNILNVPETISNSIKLIPNTRLIEKCFSHFHDMYVDNESLTKAKLAFDTIEKKVLNDHLLIKLVDKISLDLIHKIKQENVYKIVNSNIVYRNLSTYCYIRKLVKKELPTLIDKITDPIMTIRNDKIETVDKKTRIKILDKLGSDLIAITTSSYTKLCVKKYKSKNRQSKIYLGTNKLSNIN
ncbi:hypothetical protein Ark11_1477 [Candidatus Ichthyocystis hellenicum]|uniref:Uncharacterized protein n=1 Tax=Candidatus Ichthyocystis hellenicum TaxID=1561003 RepID=A0A0S4M3C6_9BURK|nr:hypothetical protein [Candidatus Ichthyocystis hellenicum]CUT18275.1 hypothetical protein Ark11_1477 [Candidatus Ichthyocystis hellenicum]